MLSRQPIKHIINIINNKIKGLQQDLALKEVHWYTQGEMREILEKNSKDFTNYKYMEFF